MADEDGISKTLQPLLSIALAATMLLVFFIHALQIDFASFVVDFSSAIATYSVLAAFAVGALIVVKQLFLKK